MQLIESPGGEIACEMRNINGRTPSDIAELAGHYKIASALKNFSVSLAAADDKPLGGVDRNAFAFFFLAANAALFPACCTFCWWIALQ